MQMTRFEKFIRKRTRRMRTSG